MYFPTTEYKKQIKISTRCAISETIETIEGLNLVERDINWFKDHPQFKHLFHMKKDKNHKVQGMWMMVLRTAEIDRKKELWFIVNGVPVRYGLREHALLSGLDCRNYPHGWEDVGNKAWEDRALKNGMRLEDVRETLKTMEVGNRDRMKVAVLYFLGSILCAHTKVGAGAKPVEEFLRKAVSNLGFCVTFPWGRYSYEYMVKQIYHTTNYFRGKEIKEGRLWAIPGFCLPLEILPFEAIPQLASSFRDVVELADPGCPRICKSVFKPSEMTGWPLEKIYTTLGDTKEIRSILPTKCVEEEELLDVLTEEDDDVDATDIVVESWEKALREGSTIVFEDYLEADIVGRGGQTEDASGDASDDNAGDNAGDNAEAKEVKKLRLSVDRMTREFKKVGKKVDECLLRVGKLESEVKDLKKEMKEVKKGKGKAKK